MPDNQQASFSFKENKMKSSINIQGVNLETAKAYIQHNIRNNDYESLDEGAMEGIDPNKINLNVIIKGYTDLDRYMKNTLRLNKIQGGLQPESHLFSSWVIHTGNTDVPLDDEQAIEYFKEVKNWIENEYKVETVNAVIHLDEVGAPHMHLISSNFIKKGDKCYWSKARVFGTSNIEKWSEIPGTWEIMHMKIWEELGKKYNFEKPGETQGYINQEDYKVAKAKERLAEAESKQEKIKIEIKKFNSILLGCLKVNLITIKQEHPSVWGTFKEDAISLKKFGKEYDSGKWDELQKEIFLYDTYHTIQKKMEDMNLGRDFVTMEEYAR